MRPLRPRSLQGRLLLPVLGLVTLVWLAIALATWLDVRHELDELLDGHLVQAAAVLVASESQQPAVAAGAPEAATLHRYARKVAFQVFRNGQLERRSANAPDAQLSSPFRPGLATVQVGDVTWRVFATRGARSGVEVFVGEQVDSRADILRAVLRSTLQPLAWSLPLFWLSVWWVVSRGVAPLRRLGAALAGRDPQALQPIDAGDGPSEMQPMVDALNGLFARIAGLIETERRFTADAAHELRTPIAAIRAQAQAALGASDDAAREHALRATLQGCDRAARLVDQLLTLARLDAGVSPPCREVDLGALARAVVAELAPAACRRRQTLGVEGPAHAVVRADATLLEVLLRNLVDNAVRHAPLDAPILVGLAVGPGGVELSVDNGGPPLATGDVERLGDRFYRIAGSQGSGSGLGWSIVRRIATVHGARLELSGAGRLGGLSVRVFLPA